jgi:DNA-binding winged helix-turn-helix (wHTH) protein/tetratricopeptide (TPR) repeat protein
MALDMRSFGILRFRTFEVDLRAGELRKQGKRIRLQEQPFQVLTVLLQHPGQVVTREELRNQNWPPDTFVDFDNSLNTAINKLREALGDSADNPRFIETLPRRGYRFLVPVTSPDREASASVGAALARGVKRWKVVAPIAVVLVSAVVGGLFWRSRQARRLTDKDTVVLADFVNSTADPVFDGTLREGLSVQLEQSPFLRLVSEEGIQQTLQMMGQPTNVRLTPQIAREVCQRTNSTAVLHGSIALIGNRYNLILKAVNCVSGDLLASTEAQANDKSGVLDALSKAASGIRTKLGESLSTVQKYNIPLEQATTPSLEALQAFSLGGRVDFPASIPFFQRAIQLDPDFAMAYDQLGGAYGSIGETVLDAENTRKAFELRGRTSALEKLAIEGDYYRGVTGNLLNAQRSYALGEQVYPREPAFRGGLGTIYMALGQHESALKEHQAVLRLLPYDSVAYRFVAYTYLLLGLVEDAAATAREARAKGLDSAMGPTAYLIAFYRNDADEMARQVVAADKTGHEDLLLALDADTAAYFGHPGRARELSRQAANSAKRAGESEASTTYEIVAALREGLFGNTDKAREQIRAAPPFRAGDPYYGFALALAYAGNANGVQRLVEDFNKRFPEDTTAQFIYLPTLRAKLALLDSNPQQALDDLELAGPYELGAPALGFYNWPNLYPVYVRGEAYLAAHKGREAAAEFKRILDHRGIVLNEPIGVLAHLQLGRACAMQGDTTKARAAYNDFLTLWKEADPDIPILKQAKAEYAMLP